MKIIAATYAPMLSSGQLNTSLVKDYAAFLKQNGVVGVFANGSTGDFTSLSTAERMTLIEAWAKYKPSGLKLINHVGHNNLCEAIELAKHSADMVDGIAVVPPFYFRPKSIQDIIYYCQRIAESAPTIPFYYYHIPVLTGAAFPMIKFIEEAKQCIPNFGGIKYTEDNFADLQSCLNHEGQSFELYFGIDEKFLNSLSAGVKGWVGSTYNHLAPLYHHIAQAHTSGDSHLADLLQGKAIQFVEILDAAIGYQGGSKGLMRYFGLDMGPSRFPHKSLMQPEYEYVLDRLREAGLLEYLSESKSIELK
jgi:N-acetylneuraminate lyase